MAHRRDGRGRRRARPGNWPCATSRPTQSDVEWKADHSPVTVADREAENAAPRTLLGRLPAGRLSRRGVRRHARHVRLSLDHRPDRRHAQLRPRHPDLGHAGRPGIQGRADRRRRRRAGPGPDVSRPARRRRLPRRPPHPRLRRRHAGRSRQLFYSSLSLVLKAGPRDRFPRPRRTDRDGSAASATSTASCWSPRDPAS